MITRKIIINDCDRMTDEQVQQALAAAKGYDQWLNDKRTHKDAPVRYQQFTVRESAKGTVIVNLKQQPKP
ncbi:MAG: hypothetical protein LCH58_05960 [Bacteroidetes bacterium]|uniref:hypothetical protein n=1 Tax=Phnomibacter sp. TaxID=2836217 RepID=UPI002FDD1396|nr:hypothetical protein [Bacteroidota bacterium]